MSVPQSYHQTPSAVAVRSAVPGLTRFEARVYRLLLLELETLCDDSRLSGLELTSSDLEDAGSVLARSLAVYCSSVCWLRFGGGPGAVRFAQLARAASDAVVSCRAPDDPDEVRCSLCGCRQALRPGVDGSAMCLEVVHNPGGES